MGAFLQNTQVGSSNSQNTQAGSSNSQNTQAGSSNSCKNSVSVSLLPYRHHLNFHDPGMKFKGGQRLPYYYELAIHCRFQTTINFLRWIREESARHSYITSLPRGHSHELMTYYCNLFISCNIIDPKLNSYAWEISAKHRYTLLLPLPWHKTSSAFMVQYSYT